MTDVLIQRLEQPPVNPLYLSLLKFVRHTLEAASAASQPHAPAPVDVERLFASVELLIERYDQPWSPFVASWAAGLDAFSSSAAVSESDLERELRDFDRALAGRTPGGLALHSPGRLIARAITRATDRARPTEVSELLRIVRDQMLLSLYDVLALKDPRATNYLKPLAVLAQQQVSLTVATLNYDLSVETAALQHGARCETGIETWLKRGELVWRSSGLRLLKLHGSIDWVAEQSVEADELPMTQLRTVDPGVSLGSNMAPAVIFGESGKLRAEGPYIELLLAWAANLKLAESLLIIGYSFRDQHVNETIARWLNADYDRRIILLDPSDLRVARPDLFGSRLRALAHRDARRFHHVRATTQAGLNTAIDRAVAA